MSASSTFGKNIKVTIFGESHGSLVGCVIDGLPVGTELDKEYIMKEMRRRQGGGEFSTPRKEEDTPSIMSGIFEGRTTGAPLTAVFENKNTKSKDYKDLKYRMRPGHADYPAFIKYKGKNDYRGGGRFSGRLTAAVVFAGAVIKSILKLENITIGSHIKNIEGIEDIGFDKTSDSDVSLINLSNSSFPVIDDMAGALMQEAIMKAKEDGDSVGGVVECMAMGVPVGVGEPFFYSIESVLSHLLFSVPGVKGVEFGEGFDISRMRGSTANDPYYYDIKGNIRTKSNHNGGVLGGISNGMPIVFSVAIKPTSSIS